MKRIAVVDNDKLKDKQKNLHIQSLCPVNRSGVECISVAKDGFLSIDENTCIGCGISYDKLDKILKLYVEGNSKLDIIEKGFEKEKVEEIIRRVKSNEHKRNMPSIVRIS